MVPFESLGTVSYSYFMATMVVAVAILAGPDAVATIRASLVDVYLYYCLKILFGIFLKKLLNQQT